MPNELRRFALRIARAWHVGRALAMAALVQLLLLGVAAAQSVFTFPIDGPQMETISPGTGAGTVTVDPSTGIITTTGTYCGLLGDLLGVHIHGPALPFEHAPVKIVLDYAGTTSGTIFGNNQATPEDVQYLLSGLYYVVFHTAAYGGGELRGQIVTPAAATPYGSGVNPNNSLVVLAGAPKVPSILTLGVDNPTGSQTAPGTGMVFLATQPDPLFKLTGTGILLPGYGMAGPSGELLISVATPNPFMSLIAHGWSGPGTPLPVVLNIPNDLTLLGVTAYLQGALYANFKISLTSGLELYLGL